MQPNNNDKPVQEQNKYYIIYPICKFVNKVVVAVLTVWFEPDKTLQKKMQ